MEGPCEDFGPPAGGGVLGAVGVLSGPQVQGGCAGMGPPRGLQPSHQTPKGVRTESPIPSGVRILNLPRDDPGPVCWLLPRFPALGKSLNVEKTQRWCVVTTPALSFLGVEEISQTLSNLLLAEAGYLGVNLQLGNPCAGKHSTSQSEPCLCRESCDLN